MARAYLSQKKDGHQNPTSLLTMMSDPRHTLWDTIRPQAMRMKSDGTATKAQGDKNQMAKKQNTCCQDVAGRRRTDTQHLLLSKKAAQMCLLQTAKHDPYVVDHSCRRSHGDIAWDSQGPICFNMFQWSLPKVLRILGLYKTR